MKPIVLCTACESEVRDAAVAGRGCALCETCVLALKDAIDEDAIDGAVLPPPTEAPKDRAPFFTTMSRAMLTWIAKKHDARLVGCDTNKGEVEIAALSPEQAQAVIDDAAKQADNIPRGWRLLVTVVEAHGP